MKKIALATALGALLLAAPVSAATLPAPVKTALEQGLNDEYHAEAFYTVVIAKFGEVRPFSNIIHAEQTHSGILAALMKQYGLTVPANPYLDGTQPKPVAPATLADACKAGVDAEIANRDLYDKTLIPAAKDYPDITAAFRQLRDASNNNHLPAFQRCASRGG